jgi:hypothetical protein
MLLRLILHRVGPPKKTETCFFFWNDDARVNDFRQHLINFVPLVTTAAQGFSD